MKRFFNAMIMTFLIVGMSMTVSCKKEAETLKVSTVTVVPADLVLKVGETALLDVTVAPEGVEYSSVEWKSGNEAVVTVANDGTVTAVGSGMTDVTAVVDGISGKCSVAVEVPYEGALAFAAGNGDVKLLLMTLGKESASQTVAFKYSLNYAAQEAMTFAFRTDDNLVEAYNSAYSEEAALLPSSAYTLSASSFSVASGSAESSELTLNVTAEGLEVGQYVLPLVADGAEANDGTAGLVKYVAVTVREAFSAPEGANLDEKHHNWIFYLNTAEYDPRLVTDYIIVRQPMDGSAESYFGIGSILNLRKASVGFDDAVGRVILNLDKDLNYVLENRMTYILPIQDTGRKVCMCIEGGETGVGFCNMTEGQIADFVAQVKDVVDKYGLDGVNFWDRNSGYGESGAPEVNTTSYPALIKSMREALGSDKILTVVDYEEPTASFGDTELTGGIAVGDYIDYAWHGYNAETERYQIVDPWNQEHSSVSKKYPRQPIAGLDPMKYGVYNLPFRPMDFPMEEQDMEYEEGMAYFETWKNRIIVTGDIITHIQGIYEGSEQNVIMFPYGIEIFLTNNFDLLEYGLWGHNLTSLPDGSLGYNKWLKDW